MYRDQTTLLIDFVLRFSSLSHAMPAGVSQYLPCLSHFLLQPSLLSIKTHSTILHKTQRMHIMPTLNHLRQTRENPPPNINKIPAIKIPRALIQILKQSDRGRPILRKDIQPGVVRFSSVWTCRSLWRRSCQGCCCTFAVCGGRRSQSRIGSGTRLLRLDWLGLWRRSSHWLQRRRRRRRSSDLNPGLAHLRGSRSWLNRRTCQRRRSRRRRVCRSWSRPCRC